MPIEHHPCIDPTESVPQDLFQHKRMAGSPGRTNHRTDSQFTATRFRKALTQSETRKCHETNTLTDPLWRKLKTASKFQLQRPRTTVRERLWLGGKSHSGFGVLSVPAAPRQHVCAKCDITYETPGLAQSATVRTANWLRHLPAPHRHVDDRCTLESQTCTQYHTTANKCCHGTR